MKENNNKIVEGRGWLGRYSTGKLDGVEETEFNLTSPGFNVWSSSLISADEK